MTAPQPIRYSLKTKILVVVCLTVATAGFVIAGLATDTDTENFVTVSGAPGQAVSLDGVEAFLPGNGDEVLAQQKFGIDLAAGWTGELTLLPGTGAAVAIPDEELERSALNELIFEPGPGQTITELPRGLTSCVRAVVWDQVRGREASERTESWCFKVT